MKKYIFFILLSFPFYVNAQINLIKTMNASNFMPYNNQLYFTSENGINVDLWKTDGTTAGTVFIKALGEAIDNQNLPIISNNLLYFKTLNTLWRTDGTSAGTFPLINTRIGEMVDLNGTLIFSAQDTDGVELWKSNGTIQGTLKITDFLPGPESGVLSSGFNSLAVTGNYVYFIGNPTIQTKLFLCKTDGTASGTQIVSNISTLARLYSFQDKIYTVFTLATYLPNNCAISSLSKIIKIDNGTITDFWLPLTFYSGNCGPLYYGDVSNIGSFFRRTQNNLFFLADNYTTLINGKTTLDLRKIDGSTATVVKNFPYTYGNANNDGPNPFAFLMPSDDNFFENIFYFQGAEPSTGLEVWRSDGTSAGTFLLKDIASGTASSLPLEFRTVNGSTYFVATGSTGRKLYKTDGTTAGTIEVPDPNNLLLYPNSTNQLNTGNQRNYYSNKLGSQFIFVGTSTAQGNPNALFSVCTTPIAPVVTSSIGSSICVGSSTTLTAAGCSGTINWSTGVTTSSITVSPTVTTTYTATCTDVCGVSPSGSFPITVNPLPTIPSISQTGTKIICPRASFSLSASGCNGSTITWSNNTVGSSITVNSANTYTATCTNVCGTSTASSPLIVLEAANTQTLSGIASAGLSHASQSLSSTQTVNNGLNVAYQAGDDITLNTDFISDFGSTFNAEIGSACPITDGLVASYNMDNNVNDQSGNGHNATFANTTLTTGRKGNANGAYSFNGTNQSIHLGTWFRSQEFTVSMWLNAATTQTNAYAMILDNNHGNNISFSTQQDFNTNNRYYFAVSGTPTYGYTGFSLIPNQWEHIVLIKGNGFIKVYKNGILLGSATHSGLIDYTSTLPALCLGAYVNNGNNIRYWAGKMDDVKIYNRAISPVEVSYLYAE